jgi:hypothetical protein
MKDPATRDRIAFLNFVLFGTTFGGGLQTADQELRAAFSGPPNLRISPYEIEQRMSNGDLHWNRLDLLEPEHVAWAEISANRAIGVFGSEDKSLVVLAIPGTLLHGGMKDPSRLDGIRVPFRCFAIATDAIVGIFQDPSGQVAFVGRRRTQPLSGAPPLRFETFKLIASSSVDELSQSYERRAVFAGKLASGDYEHKDWAPIYLSDELVDTEFGALLNTTDQLLKSWSEAGTIQYLYFNYPRPSQFPFGQVPLSDIVRRSTGSPDVLFNWNTSGASTLLQSRKERVLGIAQTGALPVTYGAEYTRTNGATSNALLAQEQRAYDYFAARRDPNLSRVVAYTMIYQFCRSINRGGDGSPSQARLSVLKGSALKARTEGERVREIATSNFLAGIRAGRVNLGRPELRDRVMAALKGVHDHNPTWTDARVAAVAADRFSPESLQLSARREADLSKKESALLAEANQYNRRVIEYNKLVTGFNKATQNTQTPVTDFAGKAATVENEKAMLKKIESSLHLHEKAFEDFRQAAAVDPFDELRTALSEAAQSQDLETVRSNFVRWHQYDPDGVIKTPSIVVSWNSRSVQQSLTTVGGHNLDARTVHFEQSPDVDDFTIDQTADGYVVRYNPSKASTIETHASQIARAIEHQHLDNAGIAKVLRNLVPESANLNQSLGLSGTAGRAELGGQIGRRIYTQRSQMMDDLKTLAAKNSCCVFIAHDNNGFALTAEQDPKQPKKVLAQDIRDNINLTSYMTEVAKRRGRSERALVFFDTPESYVRAATTNVSGAAISDVDLTQTAAALGLRHAGEVEHRVGAMVFDDLNGRKSSLRLLDGLKSNVRDWFDRFSAAQSPQLWRQASVGALSGDAVRTFLGDLRWDEKENGIPAAVVVRFGNPVDQTASTEIGAVLGFAQTPNAARLKALESAANTSRASAEKKSASQAQFTESLRRLLSDPQLRRLLLIVKEKKDRVVLGIRLKGTLEQADAIVDLG